MKKCFWMLLICCAVLFGAENPKYVFLFIGDGMSVPQRTLAEEYANKVRGTEICFNHFPSQALTKTYSANSYVTDSAAAATAMACQCPSACWLRNMPTRYVALKSASTTSHTRQ